MAQSLHSTDKLTAVETTAIRDLLARMGSDASSVDVVAELSRAGVDVREEHVDQVRAQLNAGADDASHPRNAAQEQAAPAWHEQEGTAEPTNTQAQHLINEAGSPELAKQAIDTVSARSQQGSKADPRAPARMNNPGKPNRKDEFAAQLGFASYLEIFESSTPVPTQDGKAWCVTSDPSGNWIVWNDEDLDVHRRETSKEAAMAAVPQRS